MDSLEKIFSKFGLFLRYLAPGVIFICVLVLLHKDYHLGQLRGLTDREWVALIALSCLIGFALFSIHRYVVVWYLWWLVVKLRSPLKAYPPLPVELANLPPGQIMFYLDMQRLLRSASQDKRVLAVSEAQMRWSSMQHYLYCSSYISLVLPLVFRVFLYQKLQIDRFWPVFISGLVLLLMVLISEYRNTNLDVWAFARFRDDCVGDNSFQQQSEPDGEN